MKEELVAIANITKPRGLRGEVVADILTDFPKRFDNLTQVFAVDENGKTSELEIEKFFFQKNRIVLKFKEYNSIEEAENLRNVEICIPESDTIELEEGEFFDWELEDCKVETIDGEKIGKVKEIFRAGENINLVVVDGKKDYMIPFVEAICPEVDIENKLIKVDLPEGILEF
ncbi:MAG: ribosome maturation factor RimM [Aridibacter sp.]